MIEFINEYYKLFVLVLLMLICILTICCICKIGYIYNDTKNSRYNLEKIKDILKEICSTKLSEIESDLTNINDETLDKLIRNSKSIKKSQRNILRLLSLNQTFDKSSDNNSIEVTDIFGRTYKIAEIKDDGTIHKRVNNK